MILGIQILELINCTTISLPWLQIRKQLRYTPNNWQLAV